MKKLTRTWSQIKDDALTDVAARTIADPSTPEDVVRDAMAYLERAAGPSAHEIVRGLSHRQVMIIRDVLREPAELTPE